MSTHTVSCKACLAYGEKDVRVEQRELEYQDEDVLVKVDRGGICGSDIHYYQHGRAGMSVLKHPMVIGHEFVGVVSRAPAGSNLRVGQRVAVNPSRPCNHCEFCLEGKQNLCSTMRFMGSAQFNPHVNGGFSEYVTATVEQCIPYDDRAEAKVMAFAEPLAVAIHAVNSAGTLVGNKVLVIGAGPIGCLILAAALSAGASEAVACDVSDRCLTLAQHMGATATFNPMNEGSAGSYQQNRGYFDVVFEASGSPAAIKSTVALTRPAGTVVQVGMGAASVEYPVMPMLVKEIRWVGSFRFINEFDTAVKWLQDGRINPLPLLSGEYQPEAIESALIAAADKTLSSKVQIKF
ncbi:L-idonate 5-dehydrogenase [Acerihabitans arboris]|uniref:Alcohol dehydrogenase catalytic domain-containing protein n=1 Tax=Acerihabitans arboris TaxID=2691583 RepID=A0A845SBF5_9GAMM|nr:L-idonate 5-dehydrogenase [Acerihabitans arboris]NDL62163.1 alcohol dehydrogenase catalytic domain-containing protein [Acerihabitans arboris]